MERRPRKSQDPEKMTLEVKDLDHLGLIAGIIDEIGLVEKINEKLGTDKREKVSSGQVVKAMLLNGLGFVSSPLYLFSRFFAGKATEELLGKGVKAEDLNDDRLGRVLEKLVEAGVQEIFVLLVLAVVKKYEVEVETTHLDSSSFSVQGKYEQEERGTNPSRIEITYGYSRDQRPDLKQFMMDIICSEDGDIPLGIKIGSGNESDKEEFGKIAKEFQEQMDWDSLMVMDSGFYSQENLKLSEKMSWLSRVPLTVKAAKAAIENVKEEKFIQSERAGYRYQEIEKTYGGVPQRWLIVESKKRKEGDIKKLEKAIKKEADTSQKQLRELKRQTFACDADAKKAAKKLLLKSKYHHLTEIKVEPITKKSKKDKSENGSEYRVTGTVTVCEEKVAIYRQRAGLFILATNVLDTKELTSEQMLSNYKGQQSAERCFGFLKDPTFFTDSVFLKSPKRIEGLALIMALCLLVYNLGQRQLRKELKHRKQTVPNQVGKPTERPTLRWIFQCFQSIHTLDVGGLTQVSNLNKQRLFLLEFFPAACQRYYLAAS
jgi:transposase